MASIYSNLLEQKKVFTFEKSLTPTGLAWNTNMAAVLLFWNTNMAAMTSCENAVYISWFSYNQSVRLDPLNRSPNRGRLDHYKNNTLKETTRLPDDRVSSTT